jgi:uncharacterized damage-inducible protein DinB
MSTDTLRDDLVGGKAAMRRIFEPILERSGAIPNSENPNWTVRDTLAHLTAAEGGMRRMIEIMVAKGGYQFKPYDRDKFNAERIAEQSEQGARDLLAAWEASRDETIALFDRLTPEQLAYQGSEPFWGEVNTRQIFEVAVIHTKMHLKEVKASLASAES